MYGWRTRIGVICPKDNMVVEPEFATLAPDGISVHATRLETVELDEMPTAARRQAAVLGEMGADVVVYACNASSFYEGPDAHRSLQSELGDAAGVPATTASTAILRALEAVDATDVDIVTPYGDADNDRLRAFLEGNDVTVRRLSGLGLAADDVDDLAQTNDETAQDTYRRVLETAGDADATLVVSTNLASVDAISAMEADTGSPVITVNQAMFWHAVALAGGRVGRDGNGTLFEDGG